MPNPFAPPGESSAGLSLERIRFSGNILFSVAYGIHVSIAFQTLYAIIKFPSTRGRVISKLLVAFVVALFTLATVDLALSMKFYEMMWIDDRNIPGGPLAWLTTRNNSNLQVISDSAYCIAEALSDAALIFRLFVIWERRLSVIIMPTLLWIALRGLVILQIRELTRPEAGVPYTSANEVPIDLAYSILLMALHIGVTFAIALRLFKWRRSLRGLLEVEHLQPYTNAATILIESAALTSFFAMFIFVFAVTKSAAANIAFPVMSQVICISPELIILRVAQGRAWTSETSGRALSSTQDHEKIRARSMIKFASRIDGDIEGAV